jgi:hypothetical protein
MSDRITLKDVKNLTERINKILAKRGSDHSLQYQGRNDYRAIDHYKGNSCLICLAAGTTKEVYMYLLGFKESLLIAGDK